MYAMFPSILSISSKTLLRNPILCFLSWQEICCSRETILLRECFFVYCWCLFLNFYPPFSFIYLDIYIYDGIYDSASADIIDPEDSSSFYYLRIDRASFAAFFDAVRLSLFPLSWLFLYRNF